MNRSCLAVVAVAVFATGLASLAGAFDAEAYTSAKCGLSLATPAGSAKKAVESVGSDGLCKVDIAHEGVEVHAITKKDTTVTLAELESWVVKYTGIAADKWTRFDQGKTHVGYKAKSGGKTVWAAADKGASFTCVAFVRADADEDEEDLQQLYKSMKCH